MDSSTSQRIRWTVCLVFMIAATVQIGACIYTWFLGSFDFHIGPLRVRLTEWTNAWHKGMGLALVAIILRPRPFIMRSLLPPALIGRTPGKGPEPRSWAWLGGAAGFGIGLYIGFAYEHIFFLTAVPGNFLACNSTH